MRGKKLVSAHPTLYEAYRAGVLCCWTQTTLNPPRAGLGCGETIYKGVCSEDSRRRNQFTESLRLTYAPFRAVFPHPTHLSCANASGETHAREGKLYVQPIYFYLYTDTCGGCSHFALYPSFVLYRHLRRCIMRVEKVTFFFLNRALRGRAHHFARILLGLSPAHLGLFLGAFWVDSPHNRGRPCVCIKKRLDVCFFVLISTK